MPTLAQAAAASTANQDAIAAAGVQPSEQGTPGAVSTPPPGQIVPAPAPVPIRGVMPPTLALPGAVQQQTQGFQLSLAQPRATTPPYQQQQQLSAATVAQSAGVAASGVSKIPSGTSQTPQQIVSVSASGVLQTNGSMLVTVNFTRATSDPFYSGVQIWATNYQKNTSPVLVGSGSQSPVHLTMQATGENVVLTVQAVSANGVTSLLNGSPNYRITLSATSGQSATNSFPGSPSSGGGYVLPPAQLAVLGGVFALTPTTSLWVTGINSSGNLTISQPAFTDISGIAAVAQGGTGTASPALVAGTNITVTGSWPNQTINSTAGTGGGVIVETTNYSAQNSDLGKLVTFVTTSGGETYLLQATSVTANWWVLVENSGNGSLTINPNGLMIDGSTSSLVLSANTGIALYWDGTNYWTERGIGGSGGGSGTVTSVAVSVPAFLSVGGSPITTSGTIAISLSGTALPVANGGTGTTTPALVAGNGITITGSWPNQTINEKGGVITKSAVSYNAQNSDFGQLVTFVTTSGGETYTLQASAVSTGWYVWVENSGNGVLTINPNGLQIDGASPSLTLSANQGMGVFWDGSNYWTTRGAGSGGGSGIGGVNYRSASYLAVSGDNGKLIAFNPGVGSAQSVSYTASGGNGTGSGVTTIAAAAVNTAAGDLIVCGMRYNTGSTNSISSVTDTAGNTYQKAIRNPGPAGVELWYAMNATANATNVVTAHLTNSDTYTFIYVWGISNSALTGALDATAIGSGSGTTATSVSTSTAQPDEIVIAVVSTNAGGITFSAGSGYTLDSGTFPTSTTSNYGGAEHQLLTSLQTGLTATFTWTGSQTWNMCLATFKRVLVTQTLTLPASPPSATWETFVTNYGLGTLLISPNSLNINGAASSLTLPGGQQGLRIFTDGTNYFSN